MPNIYKRKHPERVIDEEIIEKALNDIRNKIETATSAARKYKINRTTMIYRMKKLEETGVTNKLQKSFSSKYASLQVLTTAQEVELSNYFKKCSNLHHGLTFDLTKRFVYEYVKKNQIKYPPTWDENQSAGKAWLMGFMRRNREISLRKPENISVARLQSFTKSAVDEFYAKLKILLERFSFTPSKIYNLDETGISTVLDSVKANIF